MPKRVQLRRSKGWRKPEGAVVVARPTRWGNPWRVGEPGVRTAAEAVAHFRERLVGPRASFYCETTSHMGRIRANIGDLRGKDLCCWCPLDQPCHADVLLELANA